MDILISGADKNISLSVIREIISFILILLKTMIVNYCEDTCSNNITANK
jgi:hypothetical protein